MLCITVLPVHSKDSLLALERGFYASDWSSQPPWGGVVFAIQLAINCHTCSQNSRFWWIFAQKYTFVVVIKGSIKLN
jgi:hypothetical protein